MCTASVAISLRLGPHSLRVTKYAIFRHMATVLETKTVGRINEDTALVQYMFDLYLARPIDKISAARALVNVATIIGDWHARALSILLAGQ